MIERRDADRTTQWLAQREYLARLAQRTDIARKDLAVIPERFHGSEAQDIQRPADLVTGLAQAEAGLLRHQPGKLFTPRFEQDAGLIEDLRALKSRERFCVFKAGLDSGIHVLGTAERDRAHNAPVIGIADLEGPGSRNLLPGDVAACVGHTFTPLSTKSKRSKFRGSPAARAA